MRIDFRDHQRLTWVSDTRSINLIERILNWDSTYMIIIIRRAADQQSIFYFNGHFDWTDVNFDCIHTLRRENRGHRTCNSQKISSFSYYQQSLLHFFAFCSIADSTIEIERWRFNDTASTPYNDEKTCDQPPSLSRTTSHFYQSIRRNHRDHSSTQKK